MCPLLVFALVIIFAIYLLKIWYDPVVTKYRTHMQELFEPEGDLLF